MGVPCRTPPWTPSIVRHGDLGPGLQQPLDRRPRAEAQLNGAQQGRAAVGVSGVHLVGGGAQVADLMGCICYV